MMNDLITYLLIAIVFLLIGLFIGKLLTKLKLEKEIMEKSGWIKFLGTNIDKWMKEEIGKNIRLLEIFSLPGIKNLNSFFKKKKELRLENISMIK